MQRTRCDERARTKRIRSVLGSASRVGDFCLSHGANALYRSALCTGLRAVGCRYPGVGGQDALGSERDRRLPIARRHSVLHRPILAGTSETQPAAGHAATCHPGGAGARTGQHPDENSRCRHAGLPCGGRH